MRHLGKSKVTKLTAKTGVAYPRIRLPETCADEIGKVAEIFETQHHKRGALLVTFDDGNAPSEVIQLNSSKDIENRLFQLKSKIAELKSLFLNYGAHSDTQFSKEEEIKGRGRDSNPRRGLHRAIFEYKPG
jgi:hypothetical protein